MILVSPRTFFVRGYDFLSPYQLYDFKIIIPQLKLRDKMPRHVKVSALSDLQPGATKLLSLAGIGLAVFNIDGRFYAIRNRCPHEGGPVASGPLKGTLITCPRHGWQFDLKTGQSTNRPAFSVKTYPVTVKDGAVYVELADGG